MTKFTKENLILESGGYLTFIAEDWSRREFIGRFKYPGMGRGTFRTALIKSGMTLEQYLGRLEAGEHPADIGHSLGWLSPNEKKALKLRGYPQTVAGWRECWSK
jgi:hypothetical protein